MSLLDIDNLDEDISPLESGHRVSHEQIARGLKSLKAVVVENFAGQEIAAAQRQSQFSWSGTGWVEVEGLEIRTPAPSNGPMYLEASLGLVVVNGTTDATCYVRIMDDTQKLVAFGTASVTGNPQGYNSNTFAPVKGRVPAGTPDRRYTVQVQNLGGQLSYVIPEWLAGAAGDLRAVAA